MLIVHTRARSVSRECCLTISGDMILSYTMGVNGFNYLREEKRRTRYFKNIKRYHAAHE